HPELGTDPRLWPDRHAGDDRPRPAAGDDLPEHPQHLHRRTGRGQAVLDSRLSDQRNLLMMRRLSRLLRRDDGFGLIALMISMTMLAIGISALGGLFISGHLPLPRATQGDSTSPLTAKLL